jgi:DNA-binding NarL/FixJ family response regulator
MTRLLICDPGARDLAGLHGVCGRLRFTDVVATSSDTATCVSDARDVAPDAILLGSGLSRTDRRSTLARLRSVAPSARIIVVLDAASLGEREEVEAAGAAVVVRGAPLWQLEHAVTLRDERMLRFEHAVRTKLHRGARLPPLPDRQEKRQT